MLPQSVYYPDNSRLPRRKHVRHRRWASLRKIAAQSATNPANETTNYTYDSKGNLLTITDPRSKVTSLAYHATTNDLLSVTLPATGTPPIAAVYQLTHDANGNTLTITDPLGKTTTYTYNSGNQVATVTNPLGKVTRRNVQRRCQRADQVGGRIARLALVIGNHQL
ncbi:MAG: hypothetical protein OEL57_15225 [Trichlorobacter sp.]|nr:RHS repeat protein [Trichlorobacter sp.]MDK9719235.1 hypothetical protein [Trichlorobacter sp.]